MTMFSGQGHSIKEQLCSRCAWLGLKAVVRVGGSAHVRRAWLWMRGVALDAGRGQDLQADSRRSLVPESQLSAPDNSWGPGDR